MKATFATAAFAALVAGVAAKDSRTFAVLHFTNKALTRGRVDPIVSPGKTSSHVHSVMGGSNFGLGSTGEDLMNSNCTNAKVVGDNSNYWFPALFFNDPNTGEFESVEVFYVNAYYFFEATNDDIKAFPVGLSMVSGDAMTREPPAGGPTASMDPSQGPVNGVKWTCPRDNNNYDPPSWPADSDGSMAGMGDPNNLGEGLGFPDQNCDGYASPLRADIHFPSCYNPEVGLTDYANNMAWPESAGDGKMDCPAGWIHTPHLFIEVYWNTPLFADRWTPGTGSQPFVLANGDVTGYSSHADFMAGWDEELLQHIIDTCDTGTTGMENCAGLFYGTNEEDCTIPSPIDEETEGTLVRLPGNNELSGWGHGGVIANPDPSDGADPEPEPSSTRVSAEASSTAAAATSDSNELPEPTEEPTNVVENPIDPSSSTSAADVPIETPGDSPAESPALTTSSASGCTRNIHTVWETVTVTAGAPAPTDDAYARRHLHQHGHGSHRH